MPWCDGPHLADLPAFSGRALDTRLKARIDRMRRLMAMYESMMQRMKRPTWRIASHYSAGERGSRALQSLTTPSKEASPLWPVLPQAPWRW
jgi:hypothetical protein